MLIDVIQKKAPPPSKNPSSAALFSLDFLYPSLACNCIIFGKMYTPLAFIYSVAVLLLWKTIHFVFHGTTTSIDQKDMLLYTYL